MTIEVTDADIEDFKLDMGVSGIGLSGWNDDQIAIAIAAAWEVMRKKHQDDLAEAVKEAIQSGCLVECFEGTTSGIVRVSAFGKSSVVRHVSLDDNFPMLAATAVRQLSRQVKN